MKPSQPKMTMDNAPAPMSPEMKRAMAEAMKKNKMGHTNPKDK